MRYNASYEISAILFLAVITVHFVTRQRYPGRKNTLFGIILLICFVDILTDILSAYTIEYSAALPLWINVAVNLALYICQVLLAPMLCLFVSELAGMHERYPAAAHSLLMLPCALALAALLANPLTGWFFFFDKNLQYTHGLGFPFLYVCSFLYLVAAVLLCLMNRRRLRGIEVRTILAFIVLVVASMCVQIVHQDYLLTGVGIALAVLMMYLTLQNPDDMLDPLTGALNRNSFILCLRDLLRKKRSFQLIYVDVGGISTVNSILGISSGDRAISEVGAYLRKAASRCRIFRFIGDSFVIACGDGKRCLPIAEAIERRFDDTWNVGGASLNLYCTICYTRHANECEGVEDVLTLFDSFLKQLPAERNGSAIHELDKSFVADCLRQKEMELLLRHVLNANRLEVHYQPIYSVRENRIVAGEALVRMRDTEGRLVMPGEFIPVAERSGMVLDIGNQVLTKTCDFLRDSGLAHSDELDCIHVNLSVVQLLGDGIEDLLTSIVDSRGVPHSKICFEITETTATVSDKLPAVAGKLIDRGFSFSMDDFGVGFANYDSAIRLPFSSVKLDKSMLDRISIGSRSTTVFKHTVTMFNALGLHVIAEGVETRAQAELMAGEDVGYCQGYYISHPLPPEDFLAALRRTPYLSDPL